MVELPPSEKEITVEEGVEEGVAEINRIEGIALGTGGAVAYVALGRDALINAAVVGVVR